jgi:calcineurin-like phosphoesterase family protein
MVGPLHTNDEKRLVKEFKNIVSKYELTTFRLNGFDTFDRRVIFVNVEPSDELRTIRNEIIENLKEFCRLDEHDYKPEYRPHATLAFKDIGSKFNKIWTQLQSWKIPQIEQHVLRLTIVKNSKILCEYDFVLKKLLNRTQALDRELFQKTKEKFEKLRKDHRPQIEFHQISDDAKVFLISDVHFDHKNIIRYCDRPFDSTRQMNETILENWNDTVQENNYVYFLGDMTFGHKKRPVDYWLGKLNGEIHYIRGNHDTDSSIERAIVIPERYGIRYKNHEFLLMHDPHRPHGYDGWIIHGDKHNNDLKDYPFINQKNKTVNVCAEVVDYTPLNLDKLILLIETGRSYKTIDG